jgi:hypothetical protein
MITVEYELRAAMSGRANRRRRCLDGHPKGGLLPLLRPSRIGQATQSQRAYFISGLLAVAGSALKF